MGQGESRTESEAAVMATAAAFRSPPFVLSWQRPIWLVLLALLLVVNAADEGPGFLGNGGYVELSEGQLSSNMVLLQTRGLRSGSRDTDAEYASTLDRSPDPPEDFLPADLNMRDDDSA